jgi:hypothetical protein
MRAARTEGRTGYGRTRIDAPLGNRVNPHTTGIEAWKEAGPVLDAIRRQEIRQADNLQVLELLECAFNRAVRELPLRPSSGLVEMQSWFAKLAR